jgi:hypothetical protein
MAARRVLGGLRDLSGSDEQPVRDPDPEKAPDHEEHDRLERELPGSPEARNEAPDVPPTNPPAYVGPLRIGFSSVNSTVETMNCTGDADRRADGLAGPPTTRGWISADLSVGIDREGVCGWRVPGGPSQAPSGNHKRTLRRPRTGGPHDRYLRHPPRVRKDRAVRCPGAVTPSWPDALPATSSRPFSAKVVPASGTQTVLRAQRARRKQEETLALPGLSQEAAEGTRTLDLLPSR